MDTFYSILTVFTRLVEIHKHIFFIFFFFQIFLTTPAAEKENFTVTQGYVSMRSGDVMDRETVRTGVMNSTAVSETQLHVP